ncbi:MAG TPA: TIGR03943 family protein [bacterium]|nr:TIGR03943 family protein [bacterium]HNS48994.1 TIGR03943 family protein [bacterium]
MNKQWWLRAGVILTWFTFIVIILAGGYLPMYIRKSYAPLAFVALVILALMAIQPETSGAGHGHQESISRSSLLIFLLPVLFVAVVRPGTLSSLAVQTRGISTALAGTDASLAESLAARVATESGYRSMNLKQLLTLVSGSPEKADALPIAVEGMVFKNSSHAPGTFMLVRFLITCCAADATPLGIAVSWDAASGPPPENAWVLVRGKISFSEATPSVIADEIQVMPNPANPYLY